MVQAKPVGREFYITLVWNLKPDNLDSGIKIIVLALGSYSEADAYY